MVENNLYFYLKLGKGNGLAGYLLNNRNNILKKSIIAFFFDKQRDKIEETEVLRAETIKKYYSKHIEKSLSRLDAIEKEEFKNIGGRSPKVQWEQIFNILEGRDKGAFFITIDHHFLYMYKLKGDLQDLQKDSWDKFDEDIIKIKIARETIYKYKTRRKEGKPLQKKSDMPQILPKTLDVVLPIKENGELPCFVYRIVDLPLILGSIGGFPKYTRRTCRKIDDPELIEAIRGRLFGKKMNVPWSLKDERSSEVPDYTVELLRYLSTIEYETLVYLILTEMGFFVKTCVGGNLPSIDIIAQNSCGEDISLNLLGIDRPSKDGDVLSFQVKRRLYEERVVDGDEEEAIDEDEGRDVDESDENEGNDSLPNTEIQFKAYFDRLINDFNQRTKDVPSGDSLIPFPRHFLVFLKVEGKLKVLQKTASDNGIEGIVTARELFKVVNQKPKIKEWLRTILHWVTDIDLILPKNNNRP